MGQLEGKVAIVTGGGSGIGKAIARAFAQERCAVVIAGRTAARLEAAAQELSQVGGPVVPIVADVTDEAQVKALFRQTLSHFGRLDIVVNNAALFDRVPLEEMSTDLWNRVIATNLTAPFLCTREAFPIMKAAGGGRIINIGSISAQRTRVDHAAYTSSKFGLWGLTQAAALEGRPYGIAVSCLHPGNTAAEWRLDSSLEINREPMIPPAEIARVALLMVTLPPDANMLEAIVLPVQQLYLGRG